MRGTVAKKLRKLAWNQAPPSGHRKTQTVARTAREKKYQDLKKLYKETQAQSITHSAGWQNLLKRYLKKGKPRWTGRVPQKIGWRQPGEVVYYDRKKYKKTLTKKD